MFFFIGGVAIALVRLELVSPTGLFLTSDEYNRLFTLHGIVMVWFFLVPSIPATHRQFPAAADDRRAGRGVSAPQSALLVSLRDRRGVHRLCAARRGGVDTGWTFYHAVLVRYSHSNVVAAAAGVFVVGFSSIATGVNFIATIHMLRAPGMTWFRLPLFVWSMYAVSIVMVLATPVLAMSLLLIIGGALASVCRSSIRRPAAIRCCSSTCSGSTAIRPSTS